MHWKKRSSVIFEMNTVPKQVSVQVPIAVAHSKDSEMQEVESELHETISDDEDSLEEDGFSGSNLMQGSGIEDEIAESLTAAGTMPGLAAAAAVVTSRRRQRPHRFETNPSTRRRQYTRLLRKLKYTMQEFCTRCGQQAVLLCVSPGKENPSFKVFGASPLDQVLRGCQNVILHDLERQLQEKAQPSSSRQMENLFELPPLIIDGIPTTLEKMNQAQLRMFVPEMLKYSTGRGKPGWGRDSTRPPWWPSDVPWANVRRDVRTDDQKIKVPWTQALRQIVRNCYRHHGRLDLLNCFPNEPQELRTDRNSQKHGYCTVTSGPQPSTTHQMNIAPPTLVQTVQNTDGSVSLIQLDSGQTIATITQDQTGQAVATLTAQDGLEGSLAVAMHQVSNPQWSISAVDPTPDMDEVPAMVVEGSSTSNNILSTLERDQHLILGQSATLGVIPKQKIGQELLHDRSHAIGVSLNDVPVCQTVAELQASGSRIILSAAAESLEEHGSTAMVQIPVSVYEKIASSIQDTNMDSAVQRMSSGKLCQNDEIDLEIAQDPSPNVNLESLRVDEC